MLSKQTRHLWTTWSLGAVALLVTACHDHDFKTATEYQTARMDEMRWTPPTYLRDMSDNAMLQDMSLADFHFVPNTDELSGTGTARLDRMAFLLDAYGGTIHYDTALTDQAVIDRRLTNMREYLSLTGCRMDAVKIETGMPGGRSSAREAMLVAERGTDPKAKGSGPAMTIGGPPPK